MRLWRTPQDDGKYVVNENHEALSLLVVMKRQQAMFYTGNSEQGNLANVARLTAKWRGMLRAWRVSYIDSFEGIKHNFDAFGSGSEA